jgi:hypothetical protein
MSQRLDAVLHQAMSCVFVLETSSVFRIVIFQTKLFALRYAVCRRDLCCFFSEFFDFHGVAISVAQNKRAARFTSGSFAATFECWRLIAREF